MNTILWIIQIPLAILFTLFGLMLLTTPRQKILEKVSWDKNFSPRTTILSGPDHPDRPRLVYWRVPLYLAWIEGRGRSALLFVVLDGLVACLALAALPLAAKW